MIKRINIFFFNGIVKKLPFVDSKKIENIIKLFSSIHELKIKKRTNILIKNINIHI